MFWGDISLVYGCTFMLVQASMCGGLVSTSVLDRAHTYAGSFSCVRVWVHACMGNKMDEGGGDHSPQRPNLSTSMFHL
jgi:hypothetical protein